MTATPDSRPAIDRNVQHLLQNTVNKMIVSERSDSANGEHHTGALGNSPAANKKQIPQSSYSTALGYFGRKRRLNASHGAGSRDGNRESTSGEDKGRPDVLKEGQAASVDDGDDREMVIAAKTWLRRAAADGRSHVAQLEQELEIELAQRDEASEEIQIPEPRHVKYATVMAKNLRRSSQRAAMSAKLNRHSVDTRMTPQARRELTLAQREVMWNLQREAVVTIVRPGDDPVPYKRQGNPAVNTPQCVRRRHALRKNSLIQEISNEYWCFPGLNPDGSREMKKESYMQLNRKLHLALDPDTTDEEAHRSAEVDWLRDTNKWGGRMPQEAFFSSMFELADIWTENIDEEEYTAFLWLLLETITDTNVVPPSFKSDQDIECIVDKDLAARIRSAFADGGKRSNMSLPLDTNAINAALAANGGGPGKNTLSPQLKDKHIERLRALRQRLQALKQLRTGSLGEADAADREGIAMHVDGDMVEGVGTPGENEGHRIVLSGEELDVSKSLGVQEKHADSLGDGHDFLVNDVRFGSPDDLDNDDERITRDTGDTRRTVGGGRYTVDEIEGSDGVLHNAASTPAGHEPRLQNISRLDRQTLMSSQNNSNQTSEHKLQMSDSVQPSHHKNQEETHGESAGDRLGEKEAVVSVGNSQDDGLEEDNKIVDSVSLRGSDVLKQQNRPLEASGTCVFDGGSISATAMKPKIDGVRADGEPSAWHRRKEVVDDMHGRPGGALADDVAIQADMPVSLSTNAAAHQTRSNENKKTGMLGNAEDAVSLARPGDDSGTANSAPTTSRTTACAGNSGVTYFEAESTPHMVSSGRRSSVEHASESAGTEATTARDTYRTNGGDGGGGLGCAQQEGAQAISLDPFPASVSAVLPRSAEGACRRGDGAVKLIEDLVKVGGGGNGGAGHPSKTGKHRRREDREKYNDASGSGEREETKTQTKGWERRSTVDDDERGALLVGPGNLDTDEVSVVESSVSGDWMAELTEEEKGECAAGADGRRKKKAGEAIGGSSQQAGRRGSAAGAGNGGGLDSTSALRSGRQLPTDRKEQTKRSTGTIGGTNNSTTRLPNYAKNKSDKSSHFRPAGGNGGWDGITGTTDEAWALMIEQAREERRAASSRSQTKRGASTKHTVTNTLKHASASSSTTKAAKSARAPRVECRPDSAGKQRGDGIAVNIQISSRTEQEEESVYSKRRTAGARRIIEQGYGRANQVPVPSFQSGKRWKVNESTVDSTNQGKNHTGHENTGDEVAGQLVKSLVLKGSGEPKSNTQHGEDGFKRPREAVVAGTRAVGDLEDPKFDGNKSPLKDESHVSASIGPTTLGVKRTNGPENPGIRNTDTSDIDDGGALMREQSDHVGIHGASNDAGLSSAQDGRPDRSALKSDRADQNAHDLGEAQVVANFSATHQQRQTSDVDGVRTATNLRTSTNAIDRLHEILAKHNMTMHDLLDNESSESLDRIGEASFAEQKQAGFLPDHVSPRHNNVVVHSLMATRDDCADEQSIVDSAVPQPKRAAPALIDDKELIQCQPVSPTLADGKQAPDAAAEPVATRFRDSSASVENSPIASHGGGPEIMTPTRRAQSNHPLFDDGELVSTREAVLGKPTDGDIELPDGRAHVSMGVLFFDSAGGVVAGITNDIPMKGRGLVGKRAGVHPSIDRNHNQGSAILNSGRSTIMTIDDNLFPSAQKERAARIITRAEGGEQGAEVHQDSVAGSITPWGASMSIDGMYPEIVNNDLGILKPKVDNQPGAIIDTRLNRDTAARYQNADRLHPSAPPTTSTDVADLAGEMCGDGCAPLASIYDGVVASPGIILDLKTSSQVDPRHKLTSQHVPFFEVDCANGVTQAQGARASIATMKSSLQPHLDDRNEHTIPDAYDAKLEDNTRWGGYEGGATSSQYGRTSSDLQSMHGREFNWTRSGSRQGGMPSRLSSDRGDEEQGENAVIERNAESCERGETMAGKIEGWSQQHPPTCPHLSSAELTTCIPIRSSSDSPETAGRESEGEQVPTNATEQAAGSDSAEFQGAPAPTRGHIVGLKPHPPLENIARATERHGSAQPGQTGYDRSSDFASGPGQQGYAPLSVTTLSKQEIDGVEIQADEPASLLHAKKHERDGDRAALPWSPLQAERASATIMPTTIAANYKDKHSTEGTAQRIPDGGLRLASNIAIDEERKLVGLLGDFGGNCNDNLQRQTNGERNVDGRKDGTAEADSIVNGSVNNDLLPGMMSLVPRSPPTSGNNHTVSDKQRATATTEDSVGLSTVDEAWASGDDLARTLARRIAKTGGARYDDVLAEVRQALAGVEDSSLATLKKKIYDEPDTETSNAATVEKMIALGASTEDMGKRHRTSEKTPTVSKTVSQGQDGSAILTGQGKPKHETSSRSQGYHGKGDVGPQTAQLSHFKAGRHHQSGRSSTASTFNGKGNQWSIERARHTHADNGESQPVTARNDRGSIDSNLARDTACRSSSPQHGVQSARSGSKRQSAESTPRHGATGVNETNRRKSPFKGQPPDVRAVEATKEHEQAHGESGKEDGSKRPWRNGYSGVPHDRTLLDSERVFGDRQGHSDNKEYFNTTTVEPERIRGGKIMLRDRWIDDAHVFHPARPRTADSVRSFRQNHRRNSREEGNRSVHDEGQRRKSEEPVAQNQKSFVQGKEEYDEHRNRTSYRHYLPPPQQIDRPRTSPVNTSAEQQDREDHRALRPSHGLSTEMNAGRSPWRASGVVTGTGEMAASGSRSDNSHMQSQDYRDRRTSFPSSRPRHEQPEDSRPLWRPGGSESTYFGWREPHTEVPKVAEKGGEPHPYYVDPTQLRHYVPTLGLPPWRTPAPGEPGWEPILNYCEVKRDEDETIEERKRRDYLVQRRRESRRDGDTSNEESASLGESSYGSRNTPLSRQEARTLTTSLDTSERGEGNDGDNSAAATAIARRVNAQHRPGPADPLGEESINGARISNTPEVVTGSDSSSPARSRGEFLQIPRDLVPVLRDAEGRRDSSGRPQDGGGRINGTAGRRSLSGNVVKVADLARRTSNGIELATRSGAVAVVTNGRTRPSAVRIERPAIHAGQWDGDAPSQPLLLEAVQDHGLRREIVGSPQKHQSDSASPPRLIGGQKQDIPPSLKFKDTDHRGSTVFGDSERFGGEEGDVASKIIGTAAAFEFLLRSEEGANTHDSVVSSGARLRSSLLSGTHDAAYGGGDGDSKHDTAQGLLVDHHTNSAATSSPVKAIRRPSTSGSILRPLTQLLPVTDPVTISSTETTGKADLALHATTTTRGVDVGASTAKRESNTFSTGGNGAAILSSRQRNRQRSSIATTTPNTASYDVNTERIPHVEDSASTLQERRARRRSSLPITALAEVLEHRRRSELLMRSLAAIADPASPDAPQPRACMPGSRWAQDVHLRQHIEGRSRLAPATRTAGGRWKSWNHGRLQALLPGEGELAIATSSAFSRRGSRESSQWVLDADPRLLGSLDDEVQYPLFQ